MLYFGQHACESRMMTDEPAVLARILWTDPVSNEARVFFLAEGATVSIGRLDNNDICIREQHVSRQHVVINYQDGIFMLNDLASANGVFLNDERVTEPMPLVAGDIIRLFVPTLYFSALTEDVDQRQITDHGGTVITEVTSTGGGTLIITGGPSEGTQIPLNRPIMTVGRATSKADWDILLPDPSVSRPHARLVLQDQTWIVHDLGSANGTMVNGTPVNEKGRALRDGDVLAFGSALTVFRAG
jgi:pSer/pThr/pTyr-binding forkhead associated (FHA) protein